MGDGRWTTTWQPQRQSLREIHRERDGRRRNGKTYGDQRDISVSLTHAGHRAHRRLGAIFNAASFAADAPVAPGS